MKKILIFLFILISPVLINAQIDRSVVPEPGPAPEIQIGKYETFTLKNGLKVFVVENSKIPRVAYYMVFDYDPIHEGENAGFVSVTGQLLGTGTNTRTKNEIDEEVDFIGATLNASATSVYAAGLKKHDEKILDLMSDVILNAKFTKDEFDKIIKQKQSELAYTKNDPSGIAGRVRRVLYHGTGHPYGIVESESSIENVSLDMCQDMYNTYLKPNASYLAIVGDISVKEAKKLTEKYFGKWKAGDVPKHRYDTPGTPETRKLAMVDRPVSVQSIINIGYPVDLKMSSDDYIAASVANTVLGGGVFRLFENLRETHGYTYGAYSRLNPDQRIGSFIASTNVRNEVTDSSVYQILYEMNRIRTEPVPDTELTRVKNNMTGKFALSLENPQTVANFALNTHRYNLPPDFYTNYLKSISDINSQAVLAAAEKYILPDQSIILIVGKAEEVANKLLAYSGDGNIYYYDESGNPYDPLDSNLSADLDAETIIDNFIQAIGGRSNIEKIKDITLNMSMEMQGMSFNMVNQQKYPDKFAMIVEMNGQVMQKTTYDGTSGKSTGMQGNQVFEGEELEELRQQSIMHKELKYKELGFDLKAGRMENIAGKKAYVIDIKSPSGKVTQEYFDSVSFLKLRTVATMDSPMGEKIVQITDYSNYKDVEGVKFPFTIKQSMGPQSFDIVVNSVEINTGLEDSIFE